MTYRKNVSMSEEHKRMLQELENSGVLDQEFDGFSGMVQHFIEKMHSNPQLVRLEVAREEKERKERKIDKLEGLVEDQELENKEQFNNKEIEEFFESVVEKVERKRGTREHIGKSFTEIFFKELEEGNRKAFTNKFYQIDRKTFREKFREKAEENGYKLDF